MPLSEMCKLVSRPQAADVPWFPCEKGQWLLFEDGFTGKVEIETPEYVHLRGGGSLKVLTIPDFIRMKIINLSGKSFGVVFTFALHPKHRDLAFTKTVPKAFDEAIRRKFVGRRAGETLMQTLVEF